MPLQPKYKQLTWIGALICLLILLFGVSMTFLLNDHVAAVVPEMDPKLRINIYIISIIICWTVNLLNLVFLKPFYNKWSFKKWITDYFSSYALFMITAMIVWYFIFTPIFQLADKKLPLAQALAINTFILLAIEAILSRYEDENARLEIANYKMIVLQAQHEKLKHQLHPHFLFNSLNALKGLIKRNPEQAESYLIKLSEFLRFSISHNEQNMVPLQEELKFCMYYLDMQKMRFKDAFTFHIHVPPEMLTEVQLPVFSLQLLLENAIKHNILTAEEPLSISITAAMSADCLVIKNNLNPKINIENNEGFGLKNLSDRYQLLIQQDIKVEAKEGNFIVYLKTIPV